MALQYSTSVRNAQLDALETVIGTAPLLVIRTGAPPANCAAANSGSVLVSITPPSDWAANAASGTKGKAGTWQGTASGSGTAGHWRLMDSGNTTCHAQGTVSATGEGGDLVLDNNVIAATQVVTISAFDISAGNA